MTRSAAGLEVLDLPGEAPALVLLHEALGSITQWRGLPEDLAAATGRRVVAYARHGHGRSAPGPSGRRTPAFFDHEAQVLATLAAELDLERPLLVGHSDGGTIALVHAARHDVTGVVAMAPHVFIEDVMLEGLRGALDQYEHGRLRELLARHHDDPDRSFAPWSQFWLEPAFRHWDITPLMTQVTAPVLLVQGEHDEYATLAQIDAIGCGVGGFAQRLVTPGGHHPHLEHREVVVDAIADFALAC